MARIPVEQRRVVERREEPPRRKEQPLWIWPLIPLLLGALALGLSLRPDREQPAQDNTTGNQGAVQGAPVTDMLTVVNSTNASSLAGRQAQFTSVPVQSVVGDRTFWIGPSEAQRMFVVIGEEEGGGQPEGTVNINPGQAVTLSGVLEQIPSAAEAQQEWGLDAASTAQLGNQTVYLHARQVQNDGN